MHMLTRNLSGMVSLQVRSLGKPSGGCVQGVLQ